MRRVPNGGGSDAHRSPSALRAMRVDPLRGLDSFSPTLTQHEGPEAGGPSAPPMRVLIADDHVPTRASMRAILEHSGFEICAEVANADAALEAAVRERPDICLLDVHMPGNGIAAAAEIHSLVPETAVVMLTVSRDRDDVSDSLRVGARGYLLKDMDPGLIGSALEAVLKGETKLPDLPGS